MDERQGEWEKANVADALYKPHLEVFLQPANNHVTPNTHLQLSFGAHT